MTRIGNSAAFEAVPVPMVSDGYTASLWLMEHTPACGGAKVFHMPTRVSMSVSEHLHYSGSYR